MEIKNRRVITIVDCFVHNKRVEDKLVVKLNSLKGRGHSVLLVTNSSNISQDVISLCDFVIYNSNNNLFEMSYEGISTVDFWCSHGSFVSHSFSGGFQRHGLSVLINIFSSLNYIKNLGFTHFQRLEVDDIFSIDGEFYMDENIKRIEKGEIEGVFYMNESSYPFDISFHYFCCNIDIFLSSVGNVFSENDYRKILQNEFDSLNFIIAEEFIYRFIKKLSENDSTGIQFKNGLDMDNDFPNTLWNTETSPSNLNQRNSGVFTGLYLKKIQDETVSGLVYYSRNLEERTRSIKVVCYNGETEVNTFHHILPGRGNWCYNDINRDCTRVEVFENGSLLFIDDCDVNKISNYIKFN